MWISYPKHPTNTTHFTIEAKITHLNGNGAFLFHQDGNYRYQMCQFSRPEGHNEIVCRIRYRDCWYPEDRDGFIFAGKPPLAVRLEVKKDVAHLWVNNALLQENIPLTTNAGGFGINVEPGNEMTLAAFKITNCTTQTILYNCTESKTFKNEGDLFLQGGLPTFRKEFTAGKEIATAKLSLSALGICNFFIDGVPIGAQDELKPGYTQQRVRMHAYTYDVTSILQTTKTHTLSAYVAPGWWNGIMTVYYGRENAIWGHLDIQYTDGTTEVLETDTTWKCARKGPILYSDFYNGEVYDNGTDLSFRENGFDDTHWDFAVENTEFKGVLSPLEGPPAQIREDLERNPISTTIYEGSTGARKDRFGQIRVVEQVKCSKNIPLTPGQTALIDFGQNFAGWEELQVSGPIGTLITVRHGEMCNDQEGLKERGNDGPEGSLYTANLRAAVATSRYYLKGDGQETLRSYTSFYGFRYIEITATQPITIHQVRGLVLTSVLKDTGRIVTSDTKLNRLIENIRWGQYSNYISIPTDCPQRDERRGWTADTQIFALTGMYNADIQDFLGKYVTDICDSQREDGAFPDIAPYSHGPFGQCGWGDAGIIIPYYLYLMYGNRERLAYAYPYMQKYMDVFLAGTHKTGAGHQYGDWLSFEGNDDELKLIFSTAYYAWDAKLMHKMASWLGKKEDAQRYLDLFNDLCAHFQAQFVLPDGNLKRTEQTACLMALHFGLLTETSHQVVRQSLLENLQRNGWKLQTGFLGTGLLLPTLSELGDTDVAYKLLFQRECPSWLYSVEQGATTIWERWNSYTIDKGFGDVNMNSFNHYAYGAVGEWLYQYMAGIKPGEAGGFTHFTVSPIPTEKLDFVHCQYDSPCGTIISNWKWKESTWLAHIEVPVDTIATVTLPNGATYTVSTGSYDYELERQEVFPCIRK